MGNVRHVILAETARAEHARHVAQIGDRVDVGRALLSPERAVEIGADSDVPRVARYLADMIDMIRNSL